MDEMWKCIKLVAEENNGFIKTAQVEELGISRPMLKKFVDAGKLKKIRKGLYVMADELADEYGRSEGGAIFMPVQGEPEA